MSLPLSGIRVLDLTSVVAGPYCAYHLALMGADVVKVETPEGGDLARRLGADPALNAADMGATYLAMSAGKASLTLNLKAAEGKAIFKRLVAGADVLVENYRPGVMSRLGMDYEALRRERADLIYCAISGFGQDTSMAGKPAYDQIVQGMSGAMSTTGDADSGPVRAGYPVCDTVAGMNAAFAVASALLHRERTGEGQFIDVSMLETTISVMGWVTSNWLIAGQPPVPSGNDNFTASPSGAFRVADGLINIAANQQKQFEALCRELGREDLLADARYANPDIRLEHRDALKAALERTLTERPGAEWVARLDKVGVPVGPVLDVPTALALPPIAERGVVQRLQGVPDVPRPVDIFTAGWRMSGGAPRIGGLPPRLGEHSDRILRDLGYSSAQIVQWREAGVI